MKLPVYSAKDFEMPILGKANINGHKLIYITKALDAKTALKAMGNEAISIFSGDDASSIVLGKLWDLGVRHIALPWQRDHFTNYPGPNQICSIGWIRTKT